MGDFPILPVGNIYLHKDTNSRPTRVKRIWKNLAMAKRTRMSAVIDHSTMGLSLGTEMHISKNTHKALRKAMARAASRGLTKYNVEFELVSGHPTEGNAAYVLKFADKSNRPEPNKIYYEFKQQGNNHFINVSGNPTAMVIGSNDIPILIKGFEYGDYNSATITFKYLNRSMYAVLDKLLAEYDFVWTGADRDKLINGDISIQSYQVAWYSGSLGSAKDRNDTLRYLRSIYGGMDATSEYIRNVVASLNLNARIWANHEGNLTIEAKSGDKNRAFTLTFYAKDEDPIFAGDKESKKRLSSLIRWDCTLNNAFLVNNKIKKISDLEEKYIEVCDKLGYDVGFIRFIMDKVQSRLKLYYLMELDQPSFNEMVEELENNNNKNESKIVKHWLAYKDSFNKDVEAAAFFGMPKERYSEVKKAIFDKVGVDLEIPRSTHEAILTNREKSTLTKEERGINMRNVNERSNESVPRRETVKRDKDNAKKFSSLMKNSEVNGALRIRKFKPSKVTPDKFWIYSCPKFEG